MSVNSTYHLHTLVELTSLKTTKEESTRDQSWIVVHEALTGTLSIFTPICISRLRRAYRC